MTAGSNTFADRAGSFSRRDDLRHAGELWTPDEDVALAGELRDGLELSQIAADHGRSVKAIEARASGMLPDGEQWPTTGAARIATLWVVLLGSSPPYDFAATLASRKPSTAWMPDQDELLRDGWENGEQMVTLVDQLQRSEAKVVRRLVQLGLASGVMEIVERLGCHPGGPMASRYAITTCMAVTEVKVLIALNAGPAPIHVSLHAPGEDTELTRTRVQAKQTADGKEGKLTWMEVSRQVGGRGYADPDLDDVD